MKDCNTNKNCMCEKIAHDLRYELSTNQTALMTTLCKHIHDNCMHVSNDDRLYWDNKADRYELHELEKALSNRVIRNVTLIIKEGDVDVSKSVKLQYVSSVGTTGTKLGSIILNDVNVGDVYASPNTNTGTGGTSGGTTSVIYEDSTVGQIGRKVIGNLYINGVPTTVYTVDTTGGTSSGTGTSYSAGSGINITNNTISIKTATNSEIGGILTGFADNDEDRVYGVKLLNGKAYVKVPWVSGEGDGTSGGGSTSGGDGTITTVESKYYELAFKITEEKVAPETPGDNFPYDNDGWERSALNATTGQYVWMCTRLKNTNGNWIDDSWNGPWLITGPNGEAGADGTDIEFIYRRNGDPSTPPSGSDSRTGTVNGQPVTLNLLEYFVTNDFVPYGWSDSPQGISQEPDEQCEWVCIRTNRDREWSPFSSPILWSRWGQNGMDGDGVEYIFYANNTGSIPAGQYPNEWDAVQTAEYTGPSISQWLDNPVDIETLGEGAKEWVSIRKRTDNVWGKFSAPALWAYYSVNGIAEGYTVDLTNENMPVGTDDSGHVTGYTNTCDVQVYHNGVKENNFTVSVGTITRSDNAAVTSSNVTATVNGSTITVSIAELNNFANKNLFIPVTITVNGTQYNRTITAFGIATGEAGSSIDIKSNTSVIRTDYYKNECFPSEVEVFVQVVSGSNVVRNIYPGSAEASQMGFTFGYQFIGKTSDTTEQSITSSPLTIPSSMYGSLGLLLKLYYRGSLIDSETIPFVSDGAPGIGISAVNYRINVLSTNSIVRPNDSNGYYWASSILFEVYKNDGEDTAMTATPWTASDNETISVQMNGIDRNPVYDSSAKQWVVQGSGNVDTMPTAPFTIITVRSATNTVLASAVIPFVIKGDKGDSGEAVQGLDGTVMRFTNYTDNPADYVYLDGTTAGNNGIKWLDVVQYEGGYYRPTSTGTKTVAPCNAEKTVNSGWSQFVAVSDAAFQAFIAKYGFIENLTARELVITDDSNNPVAGMTRGTAVSGDSDAIENVIRGNVRIWAGNPIQNNVGNLMNCPFYVTDEGLMHATTAEIAGSIVGALKIGDLTKRHIIIDPAKNAGYAGITLYNGDTEEAMLGWDNSTNDVGLVFSNGISATSQFYEKHQHCIAAGGAYDNTNKVYSEVSDTDAHTEYITGNRSLVIGMLPLASQGQSMVYIHGTAWPIGRDAVQIGGVYVGDDEVLRVRLS